MEETSYDHRRCVIKMLRALSLSNQLRAFLSARAQQVAGITVEQAIVMCSIQEFGAECTISALAAHIGVAPHTITAVADTLEREGLVLRQRDMLRDRRKVRLQLTSSGTATLNEFRDGSSKIVSPFLNIPGVKATEVRLDEMIETLEKLWGSY